MNNREIQISAAVVFSIITIYIVIFSPISLSNYYSRPHHENVYDLGEGRQLETAVDGWFIVPLIVGFCMCMPIYWMFKGEGSNSYAVNNESIWDYLKTVSIIYAIGVVLLYIFSST